MAFNLASEIFNLSLLLISSQFYTFQNYGSSRDIVPHTYIGLDHL